MIPPMDGTNPGRDQTQTPAGGISRRRALLGLTSAAGLLLVGGCGVRLDLPQPPPPVPTRRKAADEDLVIATIRSLEQLVAAEAAVIERGTGTATARALHDVHSEQLRILTGRLTNEGVPTTLIEPPGGAQSTTAAPTATDETAAEEGTNAWLAQLLADIPEETWPAVAAATPANRTLLLAVHSSRLAGATLLGGDVEPRAESSSLRGELVDRTSALVYGLEVATAQTTGADRDRLQDALDRASTLAVALGTAGDAVPPSGWALPFPVTTPEDAARLAKRIVTSSVTALASLAPEVSDGPAASDLALWSGGVQALAHSWGVRLAPFPGMSQVK